MFFFASQFKKHTADETRLIIVVGETVLISISFCLYIASTFNMSCLSQRKCIDTLCHLNPRTAPLKQLTKCSGFSFSIILLITIFNFSGLFFAFKESNLKYEVSFDHWRFLPNFQLCATALLALLNLSSFLNIFCCKGIISP